jgi:hypothetical protein
VNRRGGWWELLFLTMAAGAAVLAVVRPDLYGGLAQHFATAVAGLGH